MPIKCSDFLVMAESGMSVDNSEVGFRNAVSRSYYCIYHLASSLIDKKKMPAYDGRNSDQVRGGVHAKLIHYLTTDAGKNEPYPHEELSKIGVRLKMHKRLRTVADYQLERTITKQQAEDIMFDAGKISRLVSDMKKINNTGAA